MGYRSSCPGAVAMGTLIIVTLLPLACARPPVLETAPHPPLPEPRGAISIAFLPDPSAVLPDPSQEEEILPASPRDISRRPAYPGQALESGHVPVELTVRLIIGPDGRVAEVRPSPLGTAPRGPFAGDFLAAVEQAVRAWEFFPALRRRLKNGADFDGDGKPDYRRILSSERIPYYLDVRFGFRIVDGEGRVTVGGPDITRR